MGTRGDSRALLSNMEHQKDETYQILVQSVYLRRRQNRADLNSAEPEPEIGHSKNKGGKNMKKVP